MLGAAIGGSAGKGQAHDKVAVCVWGGGWVVQQRKGARGKDGEGMREPLAAGGETGTRRRSGELATRRATARAPGASPPQMTRWRAVRSGQAYTARNCGRQRGRRAARLSVPRPGGQTRTAKTRPPAALPPPRGWCGRRVAAGPQPDENKTDGPNPLLFHSPPLGRGGMGGDGPAAGACGDARVAVTAASAARPPSLPSFRPRRRPTLAVSRPGPSRDARCALHGRVSRAKTRAPSVPNR
mmetsp:Transcript_22152/g.71569  ORF Transcript_22152/g.71569 Transcript_22152/m.71569 type:complete len:240 (-) Transcript_22152:2410-3129(-)